MQTEMYNLVIQREPQRARTQAAAEGELCPPAGMPAIAKVLNVNARSYATVTATERRAPIEGCVTMNVIYACSEGLVHAFESTAAFKHSVEMDISTGSVVHVKSGVANIDCSVTNGILKVKAIVELDCTAQVRSELPVVEEISGECVQIKEATLTNELLEIIQDQCGYTEDVRLTRLAKTLLGTSGFASINSVSHEGGKATVDGCVNCTIAFETPDGSISYTPVLLHFSKHITKNTNSTRSFATSKLISISGILVSDEVAQIQCELEITLFDVIENTKTLLMDAYSSSSLMTLQKAELPLVKFSKLNLKLLNRATVTVPPQLPPVDRVLLCSLRCVVDQTNACDNALAITGNIYAYITYVCPSGKINGFCAKVPVDAVADCAAITENMEVNASVNCELTHIGSGRDVPLQVTLDVEACVYQSDPASVVAEVTCQVRVQDFTGVAVYYPKPNDGMWEIGKRFGMTLEQLSKLNPEMDCSNPILVNMRKNA